MEVGPGPDVPRQARETYISQDSRYRFNPKFQNEPKLSSDNECDTDRSNQQDSFADGENKHKFQQTLKQMLIGAFP